MSREQNRNYLLTAHNSRLTAPSAATAELPPYLVLLRVGFALPATLLPRRCALTAPFHPYLAETRRYVFCGTFRQPALTLASRTLSGTPLCGVRTFLPRHLTRRERPSGPAAYKAIIVEPNFSAFSEDPCQQWQHERVVKIASSRPAEASLILSASILCAPHLEATYMRRV